MKKLMIAACAIALGVVAQAATYSWNFKADEAVHNGTTSGLISSGTAYLIMSSLAQNDLLTNVRKGESFSSSVITSAAVGSDGKFATAFDVDESAGYYSSDAGVTGYLAIVLDDKVYIGNSASYVKDTVATEAPYGTVNPALATTKKTRDTTGSASFGSAGWYAVNSVPEPTSGLLLLLGVAGLALKRKRA